MLIMLYHFFYLLTLTCPLMLILICLLHIWVWVMELNDIGYEFQDFVWTNLWIPISLLLWVISIFDIRVICNLQDAFILKSPKKSPLVLRMIVLVLVMVCGVYICSVCLKQISTRTKSEFLNVQVIERPCPEPNIEPWEIPYVHYPKPKTYSR